MTGSEGDAGLSELLAQMGQLQEQLAEAEAATEASEVEGTAGGGAVRIRARGDFEFTAVTIDPSVIQPDNGELLEDLVLAAIRDAASKLNALRRSALDDIVRGTLGGLLGSGADPLSGPGADDDED